MIESRLDDGLIQLGPRSAGCAGTATVELQDALVRVDPAEPGLLSSVTAFDRESAVPVADMLFWTEDLAQDASTVLLAESGPHAVVTPKSLLGTVLRIGLARWLEVYSPDDLDQFWLDLEIGCGVAEAKEIVASAEDLVRERLTGHADQLLEHAERFRAAPGLVPAPLSQLVLRGIDIVSALLPAHDPRLAELEHAAELSMALERFGSPRLDWDAALSDLLPRRVLLAANHAGAGNETGPDVVDGQASVDWLQAPRGVLDSAEATIEWRLDRRQSTIEVEVLAGPRAAAYAGVLAFRVLTPTGSLLATGPLALTADATAFRGSARISDAERGLVVDVFDPDGAGYARIGPAAVAAEAERAAARAVSLARLVLGAGEPARARPALDLLQRASRLYSSAAEMSGPDWRLGLLEGQLQSLQVLHRVAMATGQEGVRSRTEAALSRRGRAPYGQLEDELTAAELEFLARA